MVIVSKLGSQLSGAALASLFAAMFFMKVSTAVDKLPVSVPPDLMIRSSDENVA